MTDKEKLEGIRELCKVPNKESFGNSWKQFALIIEQRLKTINKAVTKDDQLEIPEVGFPTLYKGENVRLDHTKPILQGRYMCVDCETDLIDFLAPCPCCKATSSK